MAAEGVANSQASLGGDVGWGAPTRAAIDGVADEARSFGLRSPSGPGPVVIGQAVLRRTHGPHEVWAHAADRDLVVTQLTPAPCHGHLLRASLGDLGFDAGAFDGDLRVRGAPARNVFSFVSVLEQDGVLNQWGHRVEAGDILVVPPGGELDGRFQGLTAYAMISAPWDLVKPRIESDAALADPAFWSQVAVHSPPAEARAVCKQMLQGCSSLLRALGGDLPTSAVAFLREELLAGVLTALAAAKVGGASRSGVLNAARIVRGVEDFLDGGARQGAQVEDICRALNVSRRTLYRVFHDILGVSPKAYLRLRNMSAARARLLEGGARPTTVTQVALEQGFWELGRFAGAYRAMFGEMPSETLRGARKTALGVDGESLSR